MKGIDSNIQAIKVSEDIKEVIEAFWNVIKQRKIPRFYFESLNGHKDDREIKPYNGMYR